MRYDATTKYHEFLNAITQNAADGILAFGDSGQIILANEAIAKLLNIDRKSIEGGNLESFLQNKEGGGLLTMLKDRAAENESARLPVIARALIGNTPSLPVEITIGRAEMSDGEAIYVASCRDISERLAIESRLTNQAEIIRQMSDGMILAGPDFRIKTCNDALLKMLALEKDQVIGQTVYEVGDVNFAENVSPEAIREEAARHGRWNGIVDFLNREGHKVIADVAVFPIQGIDGNQADFVSIVRDVTERLENEDRINQTQKIEALGRLAGGVAHDINNLLFPIFLNLESIQDELEERGEFEEVCDDLQVCMDACQNIKTMVQNILLFSRKDSKDRDILDVSEEAEASWRLAKMVVPSSVACDVDIQGQCGYFEGNSVQFSQVLLNLVSNAVGAMEGKNGTLSVKLASVDVSTMRRPKYYKLRQNRAVMLEVGDNGCGIEDQHLEKIFDPFYTTKGVGEGTGLGLTEVAGIVKSLNGAIDIETEPTKGTRFKVFLPVQNAA